MTLKELRQQSGKTAKEVADKLRVRIQTFYRYEQGRREPSLRGIRTLAELYGCTADEIIDAMLGGGE